MNIFVNRDGATIFAKFAINVPGNGDVTYTMSATLDNEFYAGFVIGAIRDQMGEDLGAIRSEQYDAGWKDAKSKKTAKQTWFSSFWKRT